MYKVVLCDDNEIILEGLKAGIDWNRMDIQVVGTAADGQEAYRMIEQFEPDILITDISMPIIDGLELIQRAKENNEHIAVIVISGYDDFQYARKAMSMGVIDYILKPIDMEEFINILEKGILYCQQARKIHRLTAATLLRAAAHGDMSDDVLEEECQRAQLYSQQYLSMILIELERERYEIYPESICYELEKKLSDFSQTIQQQGGYVTEQTVGRLGFFIHGLESAEVMAQRDKVISAAHHAVKSDTVRAGTTVAVSDVVYGVQWAAQCAAQCETAIGYSFLSGPETTIFYSDIADYSQPNQSEAMSENFLNHLLLSVKNDDREEMQETLSSLANHLRTQGKQSHLYMMLCVSRLFARLENRLPSMGLTLNDVFADPLAEFKRISAQGNLGTAIEQLKTVLCELFDYLEKRKSGYSKPVEAAMTYIEDHFIQSDLSIEEIAATVYLSTAYFSTVFKNETGSTFTDYLISIRMETAKRLLLHTEQKIYQISVASGYDSAAYFSSAFKKYTGMSPSEYRLAVRIE